MKTFRQFQEQLSLSQAFQKIGKGRGVADAGEGISRSPESERLRVFSDRAKPKGRNLGIPTITLNRATYQGRVESGRNTPEMTKKGIADNPNYQGPSGRGRARGTKDRMPGTTPQTNPQLKPYTPKKLTPQPGISRSHTLGPKLKPPII